jgi:hypothetical protein
MDSQSFQDRGSDPRLAPEFADYFLWINGHKLLVFRGGQVEGESTRQHVKTVLSSVLDFN